MRIQAAIPLLLLSITGCPSEGPKVRTAEDFGDPSVGDPVAVGKPPPEDLTSAPPEVTRSPGHKGGIVILWPRVVPKDDPAAHDLAAKLEQRLLELSKRVGGARSVDARPAPENVCPPRDGCEAMSVSAVLLVKGSTCAVAAVVAGPKKANAHLLPWIGKVQFDKDVIQVTEQPEAFVKAKDYVSCDKLLEGHDDADATLARYIVGILPGH